jgi:hypothetical protein
MSKHSISRRSFLKSTAATAATAAVATVASAPFKEAFAASSPALNAGPGNKWPGRVVVNFNKDAVKGTTIQPDTVVKMVDDSIKLLTGEKTIGAAWKSIFPTTLSAQSKIAIKVPLGCAAQNVAPHWSSVKAIIDGLLQMDIGGAKLAASNITVYDMRCQNKFTSFGYTTNNLGAGVNIVFDSEGSGYTDGAKNEQYAKTLHNADFLINVFRAGGHATYVEGLTLGFKNHYGTYPIDHGPSTAKTYLRDINCTGVVFKKNVLSVCVGIFGAKEGSGSPGSAAISYTNYVKTLDSSIGDTAYPPCTIIMSTDPVTSEMQTIKMMRLNNNPAKDYNVNGMPEYLKGAAGISGGVTPLSNIGIIDETKMDIKKIINGQVVSTGITNVNDSFSFSNNTLHVKPLHNVQSTYIEFNLSEQIGKNASIEIYSINGMLLYKTLTGISGVNSHFSWDEKDSSGRHVGNGTYLITVTSGSATLSSKLSIVR